jgi:glycosyltransferase A (GT-A) superfamily protein (DUF2064 family)
VSHQLLLDAMNALARPSTDAVLGPTLDGGYWAIGCKTIVSGSILGVPMSTERTFDLQIQRFRSLGLRVAVLPKLRDMDRFADALAVADEIPTTRFATTVRRVAARYGALT